MLCMRSLCCHTNRHSFKVKTYMICARHTHYTTLGVSSTATKTEIKDAYFNACKKIHPDVNQRDPKSHDKFLDLHFAYSVLIDDTTRRNYDIEIRPKTVDSPKKAQTIKKTKANDNSNLNNNKKRMNENYNSYTDYSDFNSDYSNRHTESDNYKWDSRSSTTRSMNDSYNASRGTGDTSREERFIRNALTFMRLLLFFSAAVALYAFNKYREAKKPVNTDLVENYDIAVEKFKQKQGQFDDVRRLLGLQLREKILMDKKRSLELEDC